MRRLQKKEVECETTDHQDSRTGSNPQKQTNLPGVRQKSRTTHMELTQYDDVGKEITIHLNDEDFNPENNPSIIVIMKRPDGNYLGITQKDGKIIQSREIKPEDALIKLLTHE